MEFAVFNVISFIISFAFLENTEVRSYISEDEKQNILLANILLSNIFYFVGVETIYIYILEILLGSAYIDYNYREIPNWATISSLCIVIVYSFFNIENLNVIDIVIGIIIYLIFMISCLLGYIGGGDIKIFLPLVILMGGINFAVFTLIMGIMVLLREFINAIYTKKIDLKKEIALAPYFYISVASVSILINT